MAKGEKLENSIRRKSGTNMNIIRPSEANEIVVLNGPTEMVNKAEQMLEELLSSAVEMALSVEEKEALLRRGGEKEECIVDKIRQRISVPVSLLGNRKVVIYWKPKETKEIFEEELELVLRVLNSR